MKTFSVRFLAACLTICVGLCGGALGATDLGSGRLDIAGTRLTVSPESQTVPFNTATIVETALLGYDPSAGVLPSDLKVVADFTGPEIDGILRLETVPNEPFRIPRLSVKGQYQLDNIRLVQGEELLAYGEPRSAAVLVTQVLVTRVTSRALTLDEIRSYGVVVDEDRFHAFSFTFGFAVDGEVFDYNLPVLFSAGGPGESSVRVLQPPQLLGGGGGTSSPRFRPPRLAPFTLELKSPTRNDPYGGCKAIGGCQQADPVSLPGVILFPADVSLLNQIFSVVVVAKNAAPAGDALIIRDLTARVSLPPGLRLAETEPPTPLGVPVPVRVPGPDGELGTADDVTFLIAQAEGQAEVLVEGRDQGTHVVEFDLEGVLDGFPDGEIRRVTGTAKGAVVVRDPTLGVTLTHPEVVRVDEEYPLLVTLSNTGNAPVNLLSLSLPASGLSGTTVVGSSTQTIDSLLPGESEVVEFRLLSQRTGKVVGTAIRHGSQIDPRFEFSVGVGELGIPLSPEAIILPESTEVLPADLVRHSLALVGLGYSLGTAPVESLGPGLPVIDLGSLHEKVYWLGAAGRHVKLGEELFDAAAVLAAQWTGARSPDWGWDELRRETNKGGLVSDSLAQVFAAEASATSPVAAFERFAATTASIAPLEAALVVGSNATLEISSRTSGKEVSGSGVDATRSRRLPFAELFDLAGSQMGLLGWPESGGHRVRIEDADGGPVALHLLVPDASGDLRVIRWTGLSFSAGGSAEVEYQASDGLFTLAVDADGDGVAESDVAGVESTVAPRPFTAIAAVQDARSVSGHAVEVLFSQDVDLQQLLPADPGRFTVPGKVSNGGMVRAEADFCDGGALGGCNSDPEAEENTGSSYLPGARVVTNPFSGLINTRVVRVLFDNPISPYKTQDLTVRDVTSVTGEAVSNVVLPVQTTVTEPGGIVQGTVYGPDGQPVPFARVELLQIDQTDAGCLAHTTAAVETDQGGQFEFDYVRQTSCSDLYTLRATEPGSGFHGTARGRVRFVGQSSQLDVLMLGRGTVRGRVTYDDGTVPEDFRVTGYSPVFFEGTEATYGPDGTYEIRDLPVGTISLGATDKDGGYVFQTVEIERAGSVVERNLTIVRRAPDEAIGDVRGTVYSSDGTTPVYDAYVALYVDGELTGVERSAFDGTFDFGTVRAGVAEIEAFDGATGLSGAQIYFDIQPDQVNDVTVLLQDDRGTVEGHVYRQTLDTVVPVEGAVVWVSGTPFNTVTDANGFYRMEGVFAGQRQVLAADLDTQTQVSDTVTISANGETVYRDLYFVESVGSGLTGEVLGFSGNPVPGATIHLDDGHGGWWKEVHTDAAGRFSIPNLPPGGHTLHVFSGSAGATAQATIRFEGETPFVRVQFKKGTIRGTTQAINESGQVVGVRSLVTYRTTVPLFTGLVGLDYVAHTLETNADGTFEIPDVLAGAYQLTVSNAFHGEKTFRDRIELHGEVRQHDVLFEPNGEVRGVVLDWDGETPVAGATVNLRHSSFGEYDLVTDGEGRFTFSLIPPGNQRFAIDAEIEVGGVYRTARIWVALTKAGQELDVEVVLPEQGTVSGWVEDANGAVVPGAVVTLKESVFPYRKLIHNTDTDGYFSFTNVFAGSVAISAQAPELGGLGGRDTVELVEEGQEVFGLVVLEGTGEVTGRVISPETGEVVPTAQVALDRGLRNSFDSVTSSEGEFRFRLLPLDTYRVRVFDPTTGRFGQSAWFSIDYNSQVVDVPVTLEARGSVDGHLYEPESLLGVPGATIRLSTHSLRPFTTYASTDVDGYFELQGIPEGTFSLSTREPEGRRLASGSGEIVEEDQLVTVDLYLEQVGRVVGSVLNPAGQAAGLFPNANAVLYELRSGWQVVGATLDNPFAFDGVVTDRKLEVRVFENGGDHRGKVSGVLAEGEAEITLDVEMQPLGTAAVTVTDSLGDPVAGVDLKLTNNGFYGFQRLYATSGPDGRAVFDGIGVGWISVTATQPVTQLRGSAAGSLTLDGEQVELVAQLEDSGTVKGRVVLSDGVTPAVDALVVVTRGSRTLQSLADGNGDFEFSSIPLGSYTLYVQESFGPGTIERFGSIDANGEVDDFGTLVLDAELPEVVSLAPVSGSSDLPLSTVVTIRFSEPVDTSRWSPSWVSFKKLSGGSVASTPSWSEGDTVLTLTPNSALASFTGYDVIVQDVIDLAGKHLADRARTTFNTVDVVPPTVVDVVPRDGQNQIPVDASILVTFSEKVAFASLSGSAFQLTDLTGGGGVTTTFQHLAGERQVLVTPAAGLQTDRQYQLTVQGVEDNGGNTMTAPVTTTFWTEDTIPPQILSVDFPAGTSFVSGDDVPVTVTATDERGVASTTVAISEWSWTVTAEPYEITGLAPVVDVATDVLVTITVRDLFDNLTSTDATIQVAPRENPNPPQVSTLCGRSGDAVVPTVASLFSATFEDDEAIESLRFLVDGQERERISPLNLASETATFEWGPDVGTPPGTSFTVRLEARDFGGNIAAHEVVVAVPTGETRLGGGSVYNTSAGQPLTLAGDQYLVHEALEPSTLQVLRGATLVLPVVGDPLTIRSPGSVRVHCGASIDVTGLGYPGGVPPTGVGGAPEGLAGSQPGAGGSHGGTGSEWPATPGPAGEVFDSVYLPSLGGGGGAYGSDNGAGHAGGGVLEIHASELVVDGALVAGGGGPGSHADSTGAGGSIYIEADVMRGAGNVDASGDEYHLNWGGGVGGGGRVALHVETFDGFDPALQARAWGGALPGSSQYGGAGTVYVKDLTSTFGRLIIDNGTESDGAHRVGPVTELPVLGAGSVTTYEVAGADAWVSASDAFRPRWLGAWMALQDGSGAELGVFEVVDVDAAGRVHLAGAGGIATPVSFSGEYRFDRIDSLHGSGYKADDPISVETLVLEGEASMGADIVATEVMVRSGAIVRPANGGSLRFSVAGTMTVESGASIDVTGLGYPGGVPPTGVGGAPEGLAGSQPGAGGSHGGTGSEWSATPGPAGEVFDSVYVPSLGGGGGAYGSDNGAGHAGGGVLEIHAGNLVVDGTLVAGGGGPGSHADSTGAGGAIYIDADVMGGSGSVEASGGDYHLNWGGGVGGGGRVALHVETFDGFDPALQARAWGGALPGSGQYGGAGTVYVKDLTSTFGRLIVDNGTESDGSHRDGPVTELPSLGSGSVTSFEVAAPDVWVSASSPFRSRWLGAWMALQDGPGTELGLFEVVEIDATGRVRLAGAGGVAAPASYRGEYRFDQIEALNGSGYEASDPLSIETLIFEGEVSVDADISATEVVVRSGAVVRPANGGSLRFSVAGTMTVESSASIDVTALGYPGGVPPTGVGGAPDGLAGSQPGAGGSHGGTGSEWPATPGPAGEVFDSVYVPSLGGGGGAYGSDNGAGHAGGGVLEIHAGNLVVDGALVAGGGGPGSHADSTGAGGSIYIEADVMGGAGSVEASGGDYHLNWGGGVGGGGRVAFHVGTFDGFDPALQARAWGGALPGSGQYGGAGTVYVKDLTSTFGRLIIDNGTESDGAHRVGPVTELPALGTGSVTTFEVVGGDAWVSASSGFRPRWLGAWMALRDGSGAELGVFELVEIDATGRVRLAGAGGVVAPESYRGEYRFDAIALRNSTSVVAQDPLTSTTQVFDEDVVMYGTLMADTIVVKQGVTVQGAGELLRWVVSNRLTIEPGGTLEANEQAYANGGAPGGVGGSQGSAGGSHGGTGSLGTATDPAGEVYDSVYFPWLPGGGGAAGSRSRGSAGGGAIQIVAGEVLLDGEIQALSRDSTGDFDHAGAGGTVSIVAGSLSGSGSIDASGGAGKKDAWSLVGAGGGGRVALQVDNLLGFDPASQVRAAGGGHRNNGQDSFAAPGTVFFKQLSDTYGHLVVDAKVPVEVATPDLPATYLPSIGRGVVGTIAVDSADATDLWVEPQDATKLFDLGVVGLWVRIGGTDYPVIDQSSDRRQVLLDGAAGAVSVGDAFVGFYKFDSVTVTGDAHLEIQDGDEVGAWTVDPGSTVTRLDLEAPAITVTSPAAGALFVSGEVVPITADVTDPSGVVSVTFTLGDQTFVDDTAPYEWSPSAPVVTVEQDATILVEAVDGNDNSGSVSHVVRVQPVAPGDPPVVMIACPSPGARLAPGTGLDFSVSATHDDGVERVELLVDDDPTVVETVFASSATFHYRVPIDDAEGQVHTLHFRARSFGGVNGEATYPVAVIAGNVVTSDATIGSGDPSFDGASLVVEAGTLTIDGSHTFRDLVVLDGATVTHSPSTASVPERLEADLTRDLFVACGGSIDVTGKGYPGSVSFPTGSGEAFYLAEDFDGGSLSGWQIVDEGEISGPSAWSISNGALRQSSNIYSDPVGKGTFALPSEPLPSSDYRLGLRLWSGDDDGIGVMFRYTDENNYYRFSWHRQRAYRRLERIENGVTTVLAEDSTVYSTSVWYVVQVVADGPALNLWIDGDRIFSVNDAAHPSGTIALSCWGNTDARFEDVQVTPLSSPSVVRGGSHGGRGGAADGSDRIYGSLFDPNDPGSGGGGLSAAAGGGVARLSVAGKALIDGTISAGGLTSPNKYSSSAGGSIRLDASSIEGIGAIKASGGDGASRPGGGGGRIALYGGTIDGALIDRSLAQGGDADTPERRGAAGTIFVKRDGQALGDLILDNGGLDTDQPTELLAAGSGVVDAVGSSSITDNDADFFHDLTGLEVFFNGDQAALWPVVSHVHRGQTLELDTSTQALTASVGDIYEGLYRFDRVIVRGGAEVVTQSAVDSPAPEVEAGSSWIAAHQPTLTITSPVDGQTVTAGDLLTITASADDLFGIGSVRFELDGASTVDTSAPFEWTVRMGPVTTVTSKTITVVATDRAGHELRDEVTIQVQPSLDGTAPTLSRVPCPRNGDLVLGGVGLTFDFTATDESLLYRHTVLIDGVVVDEVTPVDAPNAARSVSWTPPASSAAGTQFSIQIEAEDYGGNVTVEALTLTVPVGTVLSGDQALDSTLDGTDVVLGVGTFTLSEAIAPASLTMLSGASFLTTGGVDASVAATGSVRLQCGSTLDVSSLGFRGGHNGHADGYAPVGVVASTPDAGGSHGGSGDLYDGGGAAGEVYDSVYVPQLAGGGGALRNTTDTSRESAGGGGVVEIAAGSIVLDGEILARGGEAWSYISGGAGGSVLIDVTGSFTGSGLIDASGGDSGSNSGTGREGAGGGGRVALYAGSFSGFDPASQVEVQGGRTYYNSTTYGYAAPGTVLVFTDSTSTYGDLLVDAGTEADGTERLSLNTELPALGSGTVSLLEVSGADAWVTPASTLRPRWVGAWMVLEDSSGADLGAFRVLELDGAGRALLSSAGSVVGVASYRGEYRFDQVRLRNGAGLVASDRLDAGSVLAEGTSRLPSSTAVRGDVTIAPGSVITPATGDRVSLEVSGVLTVQAGATLDVSSYGYRGGHSGHPDGYAPAGVVASTPDAGGSHGGSGDLYDGGGAAGEVYDSVYVPQLAGGGGALRKTTDTSYESAAGGGVVEIAAGSIVLDGEILAQGGGAWNYVSGGAGGSVLIDVTGSFTGSGLIDASGGESGSNSGTGREGAGGGGRVALYAGSFSGFDPATQVEVEGGRTYYYDTTYSYGAPGTVLVFTDATSTYGDLLIDAGTETDGTERVSLNTELPALGSGTVGLLEVSGADAWLTPAETLRPRWVGAWMVLEDSSGADLGAFRVLELDGTGRALLSGAGSVVGVASYRGEYRFDQVRLRNGAGLVASDRLDAGSMLAEGTSRLPSSTAVRGDVTIASGAVITPATGDRVSLEVSGVLTVQAGATLDVSSFGYRGGHNGHPDGYAPAGVVASTPDAGGSHGGSGDLYDGGGAAGEVYDSVYVPQLAGGGGALRKTTDTSYESAAGGGVVEIAAGSIVLDGEILARGGGAWNYISGGAGGSVLIDVTGSFTGTGLVDVSGGESGSNSGTGREGAGGGGRVALYAGSFSGFDPATQVEVEGGRTYYYDTTYSYGAPGTALVFTDATSTYGDLLIDAGTETDGTERVSLNTELPALGSGTVSLLEVFGADAWVTPAETFRPRWVGAWMVLEDSSGADLGAFRVLDLDGTGRALLSGAGSVVGATTYRGEYRFDEVRLRNGAGLVASDRIDAGTVLAEGTSRLPASTVVRDDVTILAGAVITPASGSRVSLEVGGVVTVEVGAKLDASSYGFRGGHNGHPDGYAPTGVVASSPDAGGSHGGAGDLYDGTGAAGEVYDSVYAPQSAGGGGALRNTTDTSYESAAGGGMVEILAGSMVLDGEILARGGGAWNYISGGAGGSVLIDVAGGFTGAGSIDASGGDSGSNSGTGREGAGGGGRVALFAGSFTGFDPAAQVLVVGGRTYYNTTTYSYGAPGTLLVLTNGTSTYGDLRVDSGGTVGFTVPNTQLPTIGTGTVGLTEVDTTDVADLWIEPQDVGATFSVGTTGMWVRVNGSDYPVIDQSADRRRVLLDGAAGLVSVGDAYQGVYKFDSVIVRGGAVLEFLDTAEVTTYDVDADSQVITP